MDWEPLDSIGLDRETYEKLTDDTLSDEMMAELKYSAIPKPPFVSDERWNKYSTLEKKLSPRHRQVVRMLALGKHPSVIQSELDMTDRAYYHLVGRPEIKALVLHQQDRMFSGNVKGQIKTLMTKAFGVVEKLLDDPDEKSSVKLEAAKYVLDHVVGRSAQKVEVTGNLLVDIMSQLDRVKETPIEPEYTKLQPTLVEIEKPVATAKELLASNKSDMDSLVESLVDSSFVVGKRGDV